MSARAGGRFWDSLGFTRKADRDAAPRSSQPVTPAVGASPGPAAVTPGTGPGDASPAPAIRVEACRACGACLDECPTGVFSLGRHDDTARVARPEACVPTCDRCARQCPEDGISFPGRSSV